MRIKQRIIGRVERIEESIKYWGSKGQSPLAKQRKNFSFFFSLILLSSGTFKASVMQAEEPVLYFQNFSEYYSLNNYLPGRCEYIISINFLGITDHFFYLT